MTHLFNFLAIVASAAFGLLCIGWITLFPAIGLMWCVGWLR